MELGFDPSLPGLEIDTPIPSVSSATVRILFLNNLLNICPKQIQRHHGLFSNSPLFL